MVIKRKKYRKSIRWVGGVKISSPEFLTAKDARDWYDMKYSEKKRIKAGLIPEVKPASIDDFFSEWMLDREKARPDSTTSADKQRYKKYFSPLVQDKILSRTTAHEWREVFKFINRQHDIDPSTYNKLRALVHKMYEDAIKAYPPRAYNNPIVHILKLKETIKERDTLIYNKEEISRYLDSAKAEGTMWYAAMSCYVYTGIRKNELPPFTWSDFNFEKDFFTISKILEQSTGKIENRTKAGNNVFRYGVLWPVLKEAIRSLWAETRFKNKDDFVFTLDGKLVSPYVISRKHKTIIINAGLKHISIKGLRHTFASQLKMSGAKNEEVQALMGHSDYNTTKRYEHLDPGYFNELKEKFALDLGRSGEIVRIADKNNRSNYGTK